MARRARVLDLGRCVTRILAIETSCDDTCAAVLDGPTVLSNVVSSQAQLHARYGGIVPEVASRKHLELINPVLESALEDAGSDLGEIDAIAVTAKPGLIGALLVGVNTAKSLAAATGKPLIPVDHLHGHVAAALRLTAVGGEHRAQCGRGRSSPVEKRGGGVKRLMALVAGATLVVGALGSTEAVRAGARVRPGRRPDVVAADHRRAECHRRLHRGAEGPAADRHDRT